MSGFFESSMVIQKPTHVSLLPKCGACGLLKTCKSPKMPVTGRGKLGILLIGEAPGEKEDEQNAQFVGPTGQLLRQTVEKFGVDFDRDVWKTNAIVCRPPENATPTNEQVDFCRPILNSTIKELNPRLIIPLGGVAVRSLLGPIWREDVGPISQWVGWKIPLQAYNSWVAPTYHPSYVRRSADDKNGSVVKIWFERHLKAAFELEGRPWDAMPDYESQIKVVIDADKAAAWIRDKIKQGGAVAFDYETDRLKPDHPDARIVCCSVCWKGLETIAYPWVGETISATRELLESNLPKIASNTKFEDRWSRRFFGTSVKNWAWCTMLSAHHLDNRGGISSIKFQAFVKLGQPVWNYHIEQFFQTVGNDIGANSKNRINEVDLRSLLIYCGVDALLEFKVAEIQRKEMKRVTEDFASIAG